jgi:hypothetical protein
MTINGLKGFLKSMAAINEFYLRTRRVISQEDGWRYGRKIPGHVQVSDCCEGQLPLPFEVTSRGKFTVPDVGVIFDRKSANRGR